jgi:hypothetical protein
VKDEQERAESTAHLIAARDQVPAGRQSPSMFDTAWLDQAGGLHGSDPGPITDRATAAAGGLQTASLDEVLCITALNLNQVS